MSQPTELQKLCEGALYSFIAWHDTVTEIEKLTGKDSKVMTHDQRTQYITKLASLTTAESLTDIHLVMGKVVGIKAHLITREQHAPTELA